MIKNKSGRLSPGMTVIEVLVVIAIISIIAVMGIPLLQSMVHSNRVATQANEFIGHLNYARSEAVRRGEQVSLCKSSDGENCTTSNHWDQGWIVYIDANNQKNPESFEDIIQVRGPLEGNLTLEGNTHVKNRVPFRNNGSTPQKGSFFVCSSDKGVRIVIERTGRARSERISCPHQE